MSVNFDSPPSYNTVVAKLDHIIGPHPTPQKVFDAAKQLSQTEVDVLAANKEKHPPLTEDQKEKFTVGVVKTASSPEAAVHVQEAADLATAAYRDIETMFSTLSTELSSFDSKYPLPQTGGFAPKLVAFRTRFRNTATTSKDLAVKIAVYGRRFDEIIIPLAKDPKYTVERKKEKLTEFIQDADEFAKDAHIMGESFLTLKDEFGIFVGTFGTWAGEQEGADTEKLKKAKEQLKDLNEKLATLQIALLSLGSISALALPITGIVAALSGPFAPFVLVGGLIFAGATVASTLGLYFAMQSTKKEIGWKQAEITNLQNEIDKIKATRTELENLGKTNLAEFSKNIDAMGNFWHVTHNDALRVKKWLEAGAKDADMPEYLQISTDNAVRLYVTMADYLDKYADGITISQ